MTYLMLYSFYYVKITPCKVILITFKISGYVMLVYIYVVFLRL